VVRLIALVAPPDVMDKEESGSPPDLDPFMDSWAAMALKTATITGIEIQGLHEAAASAEEKVVRQAEEEIWQPPSVYASMPLYSASEGALDALFHEEIPEEGMDQDTLPLPNLNKPDTLFALLEDPDFREPSFLFFIGSALCEEGNTLWEPWNLKVKEILLSEQKHDGLWPAEGDWPWIDGGDIYTTCLHLLSLQVYYRYIKLGENGH
jgi:hypothetical protein